MGSFLPPKISSHQCPGSGGGGDDIDRFVDAMLTELAFLAEAGTATSEEKSRIGEKIVRFETDLIRKRPRMRC
jgi:hypothetical protein